MTERNITTIEVTPETRRLLAHLKYELGLRNYDQVISHLARGAIQANENL